MGQSTSAIARAKARSRNRAHVKRAASSDITAEQELAMRRKARKCPLCGIRMRDQGGKPDSKELDHIIPICIGGTHTHGNVRIICRLCNQRRPKDGSDYTGPVTLWAQGPSPVKRPRKKHGFNRATCRKGLHPWVPSNIDVWNGKKRCKACRVEGDRRRRPADLSQCKCGSEFAAPGNTLMCPDCVLKAVRTAACLRLADGLSWSEIAPQVGYATAEGIRYAVKRAGVSLPAREVKPKLVAMCGCGEPAYRHGRCEQCIWLNAMYAIAMVHTGMPLRVVADRLGYSSITSVTNLMRSVASVDSAYGRSPQLATA